MEDRGLNGLFSEPEAAASAVAAVTTTRLIEFFAVGKISLLESLGAIKSRFNFS